MLRKWLGMLAAFGLILGLLAQFTLVPLAEKALGRVAAKLPARQVEIQVRSFPPWELLQGHIDRLGWRVQGLAYDGLTLERLEGHFVDVELSWWELWQRRQLDYAFAEPGELVITVSEDNVEQYLIKRLNVPLEEPEVTLNGLQVEIRAAWPLGGQRVPLTFTGRLALTEPRTILLIPEKIRLGDFTPPQELQKKLLGNAAFQLPVEKLPVRVEFYRLEGEQGRVRLLGKVFQK